MGSTRKNKVWWILGGLGALFLFTRGNASSPTAKPAPTPPSTPTTDCPYPKTNLPPAVAKTNAELIDRVWRLILAGNANVNTQANGYGWEPDVIGKTYAKYLAEYLVEASRNNKVPLDLLTALCWAESSFTPTVTTGNYNAIGWTDGAVRQAVQNNWAMGPLQVKPTTFLEVGLANPNRWPGDPMPWSHPRRLRDSVEAGARYLAKQQKAFGSWCAALHAYHCGPTAYRNGCRKQAYVDTIINRANQYTELRTP